MDYFNLVGIYLAPQEIALRSPIAAEPGGPALRRNSDRGEADAPLARNEEDTLTLSDEARAAARLEQPGAVQNDHPSPEQRDSGQDETPNGAPDDPQDDTPPDDSNDPHDDSPSAEQELTPEEQRLVDDLTRTDQQVRAHEMAHAAAGGHNVRYDYQTGPDGKRYAVGGTTDIETFSIAGDPDSKLAQARKMRTAALAPADPSPQDRAVAAKAARIEAEALAEKFHQLNG